MPVMNRDELGHRFTHHPPRDNHIAELHAEVRHRCWDLAEWLNTALPPSPEAEQALDGLDDVCKHANAAVARHPNPPGQP